MRFRIDTNDDAAEHEGAIAAYYAAAEEEHARLVKACPGHAWEMLLYHPDEDVFVSLRCEHCPAGVGDLYSDGTEMLYAEFEREGVTVDAGRHDSPVALVVPVTAEVWSSKSWTDYGWDYDAGIEIEQRGPARLMFPDDDGQGLPVAVSHVP